MPSAPGSGRCGTARSPTACLAAAETAWQAALANPGQVRPDARTASAAAPTTTPTSPTSSPGRRAELYATTGKREYLDRVTTKLTSAGFSWKDTGALADLTIVRLPLKFPLDRVVAARARVLQVADGYVRDLKSQGYPNPSKPADGVYAWGSTSATTNAAMIMAMAYDISSTASTATRCWSRWTTCSAATA